MAPDGQETEQRTEPGLNTDLKAMLPRHRRECAVIS